METVTCCIITCGANELIAPIHDRMPVILPPALHEAWLDPANHDTERLEAVLLPYPALQMKVTKIGASINNVQSQGPELIGPLDEGEVPGGSES